MKNVVYNKRDISDRGRVISIREKYEDRECVTRVMKNFTYLITRIDALPEGKDVPRIRMTKAVNNDELTESFIFRVKGFMYIKNKRFIYSVEYCHGLVVRLFWKSRIAVSKSAVVA